MTITIQYWSGFMRGGVYLNAPNVTLSVQKNTPSAPKMLLIAPP